MAFTTQEIYRIKAELGYNVLTTGADPYVGVTALFDQVIQTYIDDEVATTSATTVTAASSPTPTDLTLASGTGFTAGDACVIDVDTRQERVTLQAISGTTATFQLSKAHSGTYSVIVEGPITMARERLARIEEVKGEIAQAFGWGALKKVDEVEFYNSGGSYFGALGEQLSFWRNELAALLNAPNIWERREGAATSLSVY